jgi:hypothetical protein
MLTATAASKCRGLLPVGTWPTCAVVLARVSKFHPSVSMTSNACSGISMVRSFLAVFCAFLSVRSRRSCICRRKSDPEEGSVPSGACNQCNNDIDISLKDSLIDSLLGMLVFCAVLSVRSRRSCICGRKSNPEEGSAPS